MADENLGFFIPPLPSPEPKKNWRAIFAVLAVLALAVSTVGYLVIHSHLVLGRPAEPSFNPDITLGMASLDDWSIEGKDLEYDDLRGRYTMLYNLTFGYLVTESIKAEVIPRGVPEIYGKELEVSFDGNTDAMVAILAKFEGHPLDEPTLKRYVSIGSRIACEYCCDAKTLVFADGSRACGCAHSFAMRGLAKYLLINHPNEYTDDQILLELGKWKATFFPKQTIAKAVAKYSESGKVDASILVEMPDMVGSCGL